MRRIQEIAVRRFTDAGFDAVTVEEIAAEAEVAPVTVYRHFGTKEGLVLWDEFDPPMLETIAERLATESPWRAVRHALVGLLDEIYDREAPITLARARLIQREPALRSAAALNAHGFAGAIAGLLVARGHDGYSAQVLADAAVAGLGAAVDEWQRRDGAVALAQLIDRAFDVLEEGGAS
jgi:AcrR family transcriptional regulator